jgi:hypothetical protein
MYVVLDGHIQINKKYIINKLHICWFFALLNFTIRGHMTYQASLVCCVAISSWFFALLNFTIRGHMTHQASLVCCVALTFTGFFSISVHGCAALREIGCFRNHDSEKQIITLPSSATKLAS